MITGFPSPAQGYEDNSLDMNRILIRHPAASILMEIQSSRYSRVGIFEGDLVIIDRSLNPDKKSIVVFEESGEFRIGRLEKISEDLVVFGVVTYIIHSTVGAGDDFTCRR